MGYMFLPFRRYADFEGRSRRQEFWLFQLFNFILVGLLMGVFIGTAWSAILRVGERGGITTDYSDYSYTESFGGVSTSYSWSGNIDPMMLLEELGPESLIPLGLLGLWSLIVFIPALAVIVRRLHDTDRSGWWVLINFVPVAGAIVLFVFFVLDGTRGPNRFGPDPKGGYGGYPLAAGYPPQPGHSGQRY